MKRNSMWSEAETYDTRCGLYFFGIMLSPVVGSIFCASLAWATLTLCIIGFIDSIAKYRKARDAACQFGWKSEDEK